MLTTEKGSFKRQSTSEICNEKKFYIRECYQHIADLMFQKNPPAMSLLGSSGIGKSNFMIYLIWRRFQDPELSKFPVFLHRLDKITQFKTGEEPLEVDVRTLSSAPSQALYIMDADNQYECYVDCQSCGLHRQGNQRAQHSIPNISSMPTTVVGSSFCHHGLWTKCWMPRLCPFMDCHSK